MATPDKADEAGLPQAAQPGPIRKAVLALGTLVSGLFIGVVTVTVLYCATFLGDVAWLIMGGSLVVLTFVHRPGPVLAFATAGMTLGPALVLAAAEPHALFGFLAQLMPGILVVIVLGVILYILLMHRTFRKKHVPLTWLRPAPTAALLVVGLAVGLTLGIVLNRDERPGSFPVLDAALQPPAGGEDGYPLLEQAAQRYEHLSNNDAQDLWDQLRDLGGAPTQEWLAAAQKMLDASWDVLALADAALQLGRVTGPLPRTYDEATRLNDGISPAVHWMATLMAMHARLHLAQGRPDLALQRGRDIVRLGLMVGKGGSDSVQCLLGMGLVQKGLGEVRAAASSGGIPAVSLRPLAAEMEMTADLKAGAVRLLAAEFHENGVIVRGAVGLDIVGSQGIPAPEGWPLLRALVQRMPLMKPNLSLNALGRYLEAAADNLDTYPPTHGLEPPFQVHGGTTGYRWTNIVPDLLVGSRTVVGSRFIVDHFNALADARLTQLFLALRCYQLEHGKLPEALDALAPEYLKAIPLDPFTGKPFGYEPGGLKPRIWSVGPDQRTDPPDAQQGDDVVVPVDFAVAPLRHDAAPYAAAGGRV